MSGRRYWIEHKSFSYDVCAAWQVEPDRYTQEIAKDIIEVMPVSDHEARVKELEEAAYLWRKSHGEVMKRVSELVAENQRLRKALEYYANKENWLEPDPGSPYWTLWEDGSPVTWEKAQKALSPIAKKEGGGDGEI